MRLVEKVFVEITPAAVGDEVELEVLALELSVCAVVAASELGLGHARDGEGG